MRTRHDKQWLVGEVYEEKLFFASQEQRLDKNECSKQWEFEWIINFDLLQEVFQKNQFTDHPEAICNMDETGMPLEPGLPIAKIVAQKGQK